MSIWSFQLVLRFFEGNKNEQINLIISISSSIFLKEIKRNKFIPRNIFFQYWIVFINSSAFYMSINHCLVTQHCRRIQREERTQPHRVNLYSVVHNGIFTAFYCITWFVYNLLLSSWSICCGLSSTQFVC